MLTDKAVRAAKPGAKPIKLFDGHGLHILISPTGHKSWRLKYRFRGKEKQLSFGPYPEVKLAEARELAESARRTLRQQRDPASEFSAKARRGGTVPENRHTFEAVARRWYKLRQPQWKDRHAKDVLTSLERDIFPTIGARSISELRPPELRKLLRAVQERGAVETAHRLLQRISAVFRFAMAEEVTDSDPTSALSLVLQPVVKRKQPAVLTIEAARAFLRAFEETPGLPSTKLASRLLALTAARPGMIQMAEASEFEELDGAEPIWRVPAAKMKLRKAESERDALDFILPLSSQSVATVRAALRFSGSAKYLFPSPRHSHRPITNNALNVAYRRVLGWEGRHVPHGWRATFSTIMNERALDMARPADRPVIDLMLAHVPGGVEARYNRAAYMPRRRQIAQEWADLLMAGIAAPETLLDIARR